jgi:hypothetical protein
MELGELISVISGFHTWKHSERIKLFGWYIHSQLGKEKFSAAEILACYRKLSIPEPSKIHPYLSDLENRKPKQLLRDSKGYSLEFSIRQALETKYGQREITIQVTKMLMDLPTKVPDVAEREFLKEALICYRHGAFRAAIVMTWNLAYDHLLTYILKHKLADFNRQWPISFPKLHAKARVTAITVKDDFSEVKESEVLTICKSAAIVNPDVYKVMDEKLARRNSAAHPSMVHIGQIQAEGVIDDLVNNVVLKLFI